MRAPGRAVPPPRQGTARFGPGVRPGRAPSRWPRSPRAGGSRGRPNDPLRGHDEGRSLRELDLVSVQAHPHVLGLRERDLEALAVEGLVLALLEGAAIEQPARRG